MIFVACGTEKFPFDRLIITIDNAIKNGLLRDKVIIQSKTLKYKPRYCFHKEIFFYDDFLKLIEESSIYVCHGGVGSIMSGLYLKKNPIVVPRYKKYAENIDNHQVEITLQLAKEGIITPCLEHDCILEKMKENMRLKSSRYKNPNKEALLSFLKEELSNYDKKFGN